MASTSSDPRSVLRAFIAKNGLKTSRQREVIAETFFATQGHLSIDELLERVRVEDPKIGQATVYRTMKLLAQCGLAEVRQFGDGHTRYERADHDDDHHHDHLICTECNTIVEFQNRDIEQLQERVAREHGFVVTSHKMELYGVCSSCQKARR